jgi:hypothetical protein
VFHPTARRLDEPYKLYGFTVPQCLVLVFGGGGVIAGLYYLHVGIQAGGFLGSLIVGVPALYWLLGESGRIEPAELLLDAVSTLLAPSRYEPGAPVAASTVLVTEHHQATGDVAAFAIDAEASWE